MGLPFRVQEVSWVCHCPTWSSIFLGSGFWGLQKQIHDRTDAQTCDDSHDTGSKPTLWATSSHKSKNVLNYQFNLDVEVLPLLVTLSEFPATNKLVSRDLWAVLSHSPSIAGNFVRGPLHGRWIEELLQLTRGVARRGGVWSAGAANAAARACYWREVDHQTENWPELRKRRAYC